MDNIADEIVADQLNRVKAAIAILRICHKRHRTTDDIDSTIVSPNCIDGESAEHIEYLLGFTVTDSEHKDDIYKYKIWLLELLKWYKVSKEMEAVRELLKNSLQRIDYYREVQAKYALVFLRWFARHQV